MYIRFVQFALHRASGRRNGFFDAAYDLRNSVHTPGYTAAKLHELLRWFADNLKTPQRFTRSRSKGALRRNSTGLSWFKDTATDHLEKAHELCAILQEHGYSITILKTDRPGFIVYEDEHQVVAEPFADTPT
jgi:hypothetical protein